LGDKSCTRWHKISQSHPLKAKRIRTATDELLTDQAW